MARAAFGFTVAGLGILLTSLANLGLATLRARSPERWPKTAPPAEGVIRLSKAFALFGSCILSVGVLLWLAGHWI